MVMKTPHDDDDRQARQMRALFEAKTTQEPLERLFCDRPTTGDDD